MSPPHSRALNKTDCKGCGAVGLIGPCDRFRGSNTCSGGVQGRVSMPVGERLRPSCRSLLKLRKHRQGDLARYRARSVQQRGSGQPVAEYTSSAMLLGRAVAPFKHRAAAWDAEARGGDAVPCHAGWMDDEDRPSALGCTLSTGKQVGAALLPWDPPCPTFGSCKNLPPRFRLRSAAWGVNAWKNGRDVPALTVRRDLPGP